MATLERTEHHINVPGLVEAIQAAFPITVNVEPLSTSVGTQTEYRVLSVPRPYLVRVEAFVAGWYARQRAGW
jgi:hypothetical protein